MPNIKEHAQAEVLRFVEQRLDGTTCPSEVARALATEAGTPDKWRDNMSIVHKAVDELHSQGKISLSWKSKPMSERSGPYRIGKSVAD